MIDHGLTGASTLDETRDWLRARADEGTRCPACTQYVKVYRRSIHAAMAVALIRAWRQTGLEWFHLPTVLGYGGDAAKLAYWELLEEDVAGREDGSSRAGTWRVTELGASFAQGAIALPKYARVYNGRRLSLEGKAVTVRDALGTKFDYRELMTS